jgi:hypothetical protein
LRSITRNPTRALRRHALNARIAAALALTALAVRVVGVGRVRGLLLRLAYTLPADAVRPEQAVRAGRWMGGRVAAVAERMPGRPRCLVRSLVLWSTLRRRGIGAELRLGVARTGRFAAHAGVEVDGVAVNDGPDVSARYAPFARAVAGG